MEHGAPVPHPPPTLLLPPRWTTALRARAPARSWASTTPPCSGPSPLCSPPCGACSTWPPGEQPAPEGNKAGMAGVSSCAAVIHVRSLMPPPPPRLCACSDVDAKSNRDNDDVSWGHVCCASVSWVCADDAHNVHTAPWDLACVQRLFGSPAAPTPAPPSSAAGLRPDPLSGRPASGGPWCKPAGRPGKFSSFCSLSAMCTLIQTLQSPRRELTM